MYSYFVTFHFRETKSFEIFLIRDLASSWGEHICSQYTQSMYIYVWTLDNWLLPLEAKMELDVVVVEWSKKHW